MRGTRGAALYRTTAWSYKFDRLRAVFSGAPTASDKDCDYGFFPLDHINHPTVFIHSFIMKQTSLVSSLSRTPSSAVKRFLWRRQIWFESTFALSMLEPWEKMLIMGVVMFLSSLFVIGAHTPHRTITPPVTACCLVFVGVSSRTLPSFCWRPAYFSHGPRPVCFLFLVPHIAPGVFIWTLVLSPTCYNTFLSRTAIMFAEPLLRAQDRAIKSRSPLRKFLWRKRVWFESTFGLSVMEPWERNMVLTFFFIAWALLTVACYRTLPNTLKFWGETNQRDSHA
ncbi:hypothetical protein OPQ81_006708 [Rhizoctonia solani]|nr:hypothetical protein OPQ81_006708 [Rhizoctonia solani]